MGKTPLGKPFTVNRRRGRPVRRVFGRNRVDVNHSAVALFMLDLVEGYGLTLDEAQERTAEWFRRRGGRVSPSQARKAYCHYFVRHRRLNAAQVVAVEQRFAFYRSLHDDAELTAFLDRVAPA